MPDEVGERSDEGGDIGPSGGVENAVHTVLLAHSPEDARVAEGGLGTGGGIKLHRQGHQIEEHNNTPACRHEDDARVCVDKPGEHTDEGKPHDELAGDLSRPDGCHAEMKWRVGLSVLDSVTRLVGGHSQSGNGCAAVVTLAQDKPSVRGVVVVGEFARARCDGDAFHTGILHDSCSRLCAGESGERGLSCIFAVNAFDAHGRPK